MQPQLVDANRRLVLELESPFSTVLVLNIFPLRAHTRFEKMVVGLECELAGRADVVLQLILLAELFFHGDSDDYDINNSHGCPKTPLLNQTR